MEKFFISRQGNDILFYKESSDSMWQKTLGKYTYGKITNKKILEGEIFVNCVNEILNTKYDLKHLLSISPKEIKKLKVSE
jgi:hypothetical protein